MFDTINIHQLNKARQNLYSYEHKRDQLNGLDNLNQGLDILSEHLKAIDIIPFNDTERNLIKTYKRNSSEWIRNKIEHCRDDEFDLPTLYYCKNVIELFENFNEVTGPDKNMHELKLTIIKRIIIIRVEEGDLIISNIENRPTAEQELYILLLAEIIAKC